MCLGGHKILVDAPLTQWAALISLDKAAHPLQHCGYCESDRKRSLQGDNLGSALGGTVVVIKDNVLCKLQSFYKISPYCSFHIDH